MNAIELLDGLRAAGWSVAVHNDYRIAGEPHTFYLLTHPCGVWAKGEARTDLGALRSASIEAEQRMALAGQTSNEAAVLRTNFAAYLVAAYKADPVGTAQACDERIDQTGRLLEIVRRMADERQS